MNRAWLIIFLVAFVSCGQNAAKQVADKNAIVKTENGDAVQNFSKDDTAMNAAIAEAKRTYPEFERMLLAGDTSAFEMSIKMAFKQDEQVEHMWLIDLHTRDGKLYGILGSEPYYVDYISTGDTVLVDRKDISDWVYARNGRMVGGYTLRVMYNAMSEEEKQEFRATLPYEIEQN